MMVVSEVGRQASSTKKDSVPSHSREHSVRLISETIPVEFEFCSKFH